MTTESRRDLGRTSPTPTSQGTPSDERRDTWNPAQYERFRNERSRPFFELMALVQPHPAMRVIDLGCGTGELTQTLHHHLQARETLGLDSSDAMLANAVPEEGLRFIKGDITGFAQQASESPDACFDLIFSNAALQWVEDHPALLAGIAARLTERGQLAVQVPANGDHPSHLVAADVAQEEPFRSVLCGHVRYFPILAPEDYAALLDKLGFVEQHVRLQVFGHHLGTRGDVVEWVKGTLLTDYQKRMPATLYEQFLERYRMKLLPQLEDSQPFFYPFKRILLWGKRG